LSNFVYGGILYIVMMSPMLCVNGKNEEKYFTYLSLSLPLHVIIINNIIKIMISHVAVVPFIFICFTC